jgi:hypothetical protein
MHAPLHAVHLYLRHCHASPQQSPDLSHVCAVYRLLVLLLPLPCHSFVVDLAGGCGASPAALANYGSGVAVLIVNPGIKVQLAKFEVCQNPGCFDPAYEAAKLRGAKRCVKGKCPA